MQTIGGGTATEGVDYAAAREEDIIVVPGATSHKVGLVVLHEDTDDDEPDETVRVRISDAWVTDQFGLRLVQSKITTYAITTETDGTITTTETTTGLTGVATGTIDCAGDVDRHKPDMGLAIDQPTWGRTTNSA